MHPLRSEVACTGPTAIYPLQSLPDWLYDECDPIMDYFDAWELDTCRVFQSRKPLINSVPLAACRPGGSYIVVHCSSK